ncbi:MAG: ABC transporter permease [Gemmataceae bacterium]
MEEPLTIIERRKVRQLLGLRELFRYRELLYFLASRDIKVRYKQTVLGAAWAILQPVATMIVFAVFLGRVAGLRTDPIPYPLFVFAGTLPWSFFTNAVTSASQSVVGNQNLITKVYFPRLLIPMAATGASLVDFGFALGIFLILMVVWGFLPSITIMAIPMLLICLVLCAVGVGSWISALTVGYRDFRYIVPFGMQLWMFATPCIYMQTERIESSVGMMWISLNPAYGLIENFRRSLLGYELDVSSLGVSAALSVFLFLTGCLYFRATEKSFADII